MSQKHSSEGQLRDDSGDAPEMASRRWNKESLMYLDCSGGKWEATQQGVDIIGRGSSAPRAVEDYARQLAEQQEAEE